MIIYTLDGERETKQAHVNLTVIQLKQLSNSALFSQRNNNILRET